MDCCRTSRRLGGEEVKVVVRSGFEEMKASPWEKDDAMDEGIPILQFHGAEGIHAQGRQADRRAVREGEGREATPRAAATWCRPASRTCSSNATTCWSPSARRTPSRGSSATSASNSTNGTCRWSITVTYRSRPTRRVFFGGDAAFGPKNIIWAVAHGHEAAVSIDLLCNGQDVKVRPSPLVNLSSQKMGIHEWSYDNDVSLDLRFKVPHAPKELTLHNREHGSGARLRPRSSASRKRSAASTATSRRCSTKNLCIECDACVDICPVDCITFTPNDPEDVLRTHLTAPAHNRRRISMSPTFSRPAA